MLFENNQLERSKILNTLKIGEFNISPRSNSFREVQKYIRSIEDENKIMAELELYIYVCFKIFDEINVEIMNEFVRKYMQSEERFLGRSAIIKHVAYMAYDMLLLNRMEHIDDPLFFLLLEVINDITKELNSKSVSRNEN